MLTAAMCAGAVAYYTGSAWAGALAGIGGSLVFALIHGVTSITFRGNQLIAGVALNFLASGLTVLAAQSLFGQGGRTPPLTGAARFGELHLPFAEALRGYLLIVGETEIVPAWSVDIHDMEGEGCEITGIDFSDLPYRDTIGSDDAPELTRTLADETAAAYRTLEDDDSITACA